MIPQPGDVLRIGEEASVQFKHRPILFRVIRAQADRQTYIGWVWLDGYEINSHGDALERRSIWVQLAGIRVPARPAAPQHPGVPRASNQRAQIARREPGNRTGNVRTPASAPPVRRG